MTNALAFINAIQINLLDEQGKVTATTKTPIEFLARESTGDRIVP